MPEINRRQALGTAGAGVVGAMAATGSEAGSAAGSANPAGTGQNGTGQNGTGQEGSSQQDGGQEPGSGPDYVFPLTRSEPNSFRGGSLRGAHGRNFPVLQGQNASVYFVHLEVGGMREPHWHPSAWELNYVISGQVRWTILGAHGDGKYHNAVFEAGAGDLVFAPQGFLHYFENASQDQPLDVLVIFNTSTGEPDDDIGIVGALNSLPRDVLAASFGVPESAFEQVPKKVEPVVITSRR